MMSFFNERKPLLAINNYSCVYLFKVSPRVARVRVSKAGYAKSEYFAFGTRGVMKANIGFLAQILYSLLWYRCLTSTVRFLKNESRFPMLL